MSFRYRVLYRVGFTPWDQDHVPAELSALVEGPTALAPARALDVGCGTGTQAIYLAEHGQLDEPADLDLLCVRDLIEHDVFEGVGWKPELGATSAGGRWSCQGQPTVSHPSRDHR